MREQPARLTDEQQALVVRHVPLAKKLARPFVRARRGHGDDLVGAALLALCQAAGRFDPAVGTSLGQFCATRIRGALIDECERIDRAGFKGRVPKGVTVEPLCDHDVIETGPPAAEDLVMLRDQVEVALARLDERYRRTLRLVFLAGLGVPAAAAELEVSRSRVYFVLGEVRRLLAA
jgi:RNA polymerase sigma factor (sigma-70 family)